MASITKTLFRTAIIGGLAVGGLTLIVGPQRMCTGAAQVKYTLVSWFDQNVDDPIVIRQQLKKLQQQYPERIKKVRRALTAVDGDIAAIDREVEVASRVVNMAQGDLNTLASMVEEANVQLAADTMDRDVVLKFHGNHLTLDQTYERANRIKQAAVNYQDRKVQGERELSLLENQRKRLSDQLAKLESEYAAFQSQVWQIERQIAAITRDKELVKMMEEREEVLDDNGRFQINSLEQLTARLDSVRKEQQAILESYNEQFTEEDYVSVASGRLILEGIGDPFDWTLEEELNETPVAETFPIMPLVIDERAHKGATNEPPNNKVASLPNQ